MSDGKRTEVVCTKLTERMALDLLRLASLEDRSVSEYLYLMVSERLYGRMVHLLDACGQSTSLPKVDR